MNKSEVKTKEKIMLPLRLPPDTYKNMCRKINLKKEEVRGYSINQYITELIDKDMEERRNG